MNGRQRRDLLASAFWQLALIFLIACWWIIATVIWAMAHQATPTAAQPYGWNYPWACCSNKDCGEIPDSAVKEGPDGYTLTLTPAMHPMIVEETVITVAYGDPKIKHSPDGRFHWCGHRQLKNPAGKVVAGGTTICLFVPPRGY